MSRRNIVIFGANGYLGKRVVAKLNSLVDGDYKVYGFTREDRFVDHGLEKVLADSKVYFMEGPSNHSDVLSMSTEHKLDQQVRLKRCCELADSVVLISSAWCNDTYKDDQRDYIVYRNHKIDLEKVAVAFKNSSIVRLASVIFREDIKFGTIASDLVRSVRSGKRFKARKSDSIVDVIDGESTISLLVSEFLNDEKASVGRRVCINSRESILAGDIDSKIQSVGLTGKTTPISFVNSFVNSGEVWEQWHGESSIQLLKALI